MRPSLFFPPAFGAAIVAGLAFCAQAPASGLIFQTLYSFANGAQGAYPSSRLLIAADGSLYGSTGGGGEFGNGEIFHLNRPAVEGQPWPITVLYSFRGGATDGTSPQDLAVGAEGAIYGTTSSGGPNGLGTVFKLTPPSQAGGAWTETVLHFFTGPDGGFPVAGVTLGYKGALFGTTAFGGASQSGVIFELAPPAQRGGTYTEKVLYSFTGGSDGGSPSCGLAIYSSSELYGTAATGGASGNGSAFRLVPPAVAGGAWQLEVLYSFKGGADGTLPYGGRLVFGSGYSLYGTTLGESLGRSNGGTVFQLKPPAVAGQPWTETPLHLFGISSDDGFGPESGVVIGPSGVLYGNTYSSVSSSSSGLVFALVPPAVAGGVWTEEMLYSFASSGASGGSPATPLAISASGGIFGTTSIGGQNGFGNVFALR